MLKFTPVKERWRGISGVKRNTIWEPMRYTNCCPPLLSLLYHSPTHSKAAAVTIKFDCAIAQAVSRWLPTAAARVRARVRSCGICGGQSGTRAGFL
jgi:hypothetical protein